jgi:hypothetical protein
MSEIKSAQGEVGGANKKLPEFGRRQGAMGIGFFLLIVALFMGAGAKGALGQLPFYVAGAGALLILVSAVAGIVAWVSAKARARNNTPA